jgi:hypothetical protein
MNSASKGLRPTVGLRRPKNTLRVGEGRRLARKRLRGRFQSARRPPAGGRHARRMNSASRGLRPTVGLRRPKNTLRVGEGRRLARKRLRGRFQSARRPPAGGRHARRMNSASRGLRPTVGLRRPKNTLRVGEGRRPARSASEGRFQSAQSLRPTVGLRRPERHSLRRRRPTPGAQAPQKADFNRREGLRPAVGLRRPKNTLRVGEGRRLARKRLGRPISIGAKAFGQRSACADRKILFASAKADARRVAP